MKLPSTILRILAIAALTGACGGDSSTGEVADTNVDGSIFPDTVGADTGEVPTDTATPDTVVADTVTKDAPDEDDAEVLEVVEDVADGDVADGDAAEDGDAVDVSDAGDVALTIAERCFPELDDNGTEATPDYDQFASFVAASHCLGSDHQDITGVEKVVFLGDSVTVGTPNEEHLLSIENEHFYRNRLADWLADTFGLDRGEEVISWGLWKAYDYFSGQGSQKVSGDFSNCSKWGARTDDLLDGGGQIGSCFPDGGSPAKTLVVFTMGGNDIAAITQKGGEASEAEAESGYPTIWALAESTIAYLEEAIAWLKDPERFPNGSYVVYANPYEFTDGTGRTDACTPQSSLTIPGIGDIDLSGLGISVASLAGYTEWAHPEVQAEMVVWILNEYARVAAEYQVDMIWTLEHFCGHGYVATGPDADTDNRCYLGPDAALWFDVSCIHPNAAGHAALFEMFKAVIEE